VPGEALPACWAVELSAMRQRCQVIAKGKVSAFSLDGSRRSGH